MEYAYFNGPVHRGARRILCGSRKYGATRSHVESAEEHILRRRSPPRHPPTPETENIYLGSKFDGGSVFAVAGVVSAAPPVVNGLQRGYELTLAGKNVPVLARLIKGSRRSY